MQVDYTPLWQHIATRIKPQVSEGVFQRWFQAVELVAADETRLKLSVPDQIYQVWIEANFLGQVHSAVTEVLGEPREIQFTIRENGGTATPNCAEPIEEMGPDLVKSPESSAPVPTAVKVAAQTRQICMPGEGMNPRYTFETFVVGENNRHAHAAAVAVAQSPGRTYNPLFIHGGVGLGKTHLMQAIGQHVMQSKKGAKVVYLTSEQFTNDFIYAIQHNSLPKFRKKYRQADLLLIDDIQFLAGKERSQEEFFHTFNTLFQGNMQVVLSSDRPPSELSTLEQRLVSRFEWGMTTMLETPDVETRVAILRKKSELLSIPVNDSTINFLAQRIRSNIRRLEGALVRIASYVSLCGNSLTTDEIERRLSDVLQEEARRVVTIDQIQKRVAEQYDVRIADMTSKRRPQNIAFPRQIAMYLARKLTNASLSEIGEAFGGRDHGTVLHACKTVIAQMSSAEHVRRKVSFIEGQLSR